MSASDYTLDTAFFQAMEQPDVTGAEVRVHLDVDHKNDAYYCRFKAEGKLFIPCDRCLEPMTWPVSLEEELTVKYGEEYDDSTDGVLVIPQNDTHLDLAPLLCDMMLLSIPMRHVHEEGDCDPAMRQILQDHASTAHVEGDDPADEGPQA